MPEDFRYASIVLDTHLDKPLDYALGDFANVAEPGARVLVPLKGHLRKGYIYKLHNRPEVDKIKPILKIFPKERNISSKLFELALWMAAYYASPLSKIFSCMVPTSIRKEIQPKAVWLTLAKGKEKTLSFLPELRYKAPIQAEILEKLLQSPKGLFQKDLPAHAVRSLLQKKLLSAKKVSGSDDFLFEEEFFPTKPKSLNFEQQKALTAIEATMEKGIFETHLIFGITGSGKTEVYMQAIEKALSLGKKALILVPEVALTAQAIQHFRARFSQKIAILHHRRSHGQKAEAWESIQRNEAKIILGARSAIFCPATDLGLIVIDEEHDSSYKQEEEAPTYHARDVAIMRGSLENVCVVLGSATPSLQSFYNASKGKYRLHTLSHRATSSLLPQVTIVSMKEAWEQAQGFTHFSKELIEGIKKRLPQGEQTLLFLNRRGYYSSQCCPSCSYVKGCPHCDISLTFHKQDNFLSCHHCGYRTEPLRKCPECGSEILTFKGFGTEHVERSLKGLFPDIRTLRMDRDTTKTKDAHEELINRFRTGKADVLIGTQMIAKGLHFPHVTLVGILQADTMLSLPDFRASEQVFQLITQVAGRSGRGDIPGEVILQTLLPKNATIQLAAGQNYISFYDQEIRMRKTYGYPPFCKLIKLLFTGKDAAKVEERAQAFRKEVLRHSPLFLECFPVLPCGYAKIKDNFRFQCLIRCFQILPLTTRLLSLKEQFSWNKVRLLMNIDPMSTFF